MCVILYTEKGVKHMRKKIKLVAFVLVISVFSCSVFSGCILFDLGRVISRYQLEQSKIDPVENVFDEIYNLIIDARLGNETFLTDKDIYLDYDFGEFDNLQIQNCNGNRIVITFINEDGVKLFMRIYVWKGEERAAVPYDYDFETKKLYGEKDFDFFCEAFLTEYCKWAENESQFTADNLGNYSFKEVTPIWDKEGKY